MVESTLHIVAVPRRFVESDWGGTETYVLETGKRIIGAGHEFEILCPSIFSDVLNATVGGIAVRRTPYFYPMLGLSESARQRLDKVGGNVFSFSLMRALSQIPSLDLIHLHTGNRVGGIARTVARRRRVPYVISLHGGHYTIPEQELENLTAPARGTLDWGKALGWWVGSRHVLRDASAILCVGRREQQEVQRRFPNKRVEYFPNGVDIDHFVRGDGNRFRDRYGIPQTARLLVTVARISPQKNQLFLAKVLPQLRRSNPAIHVALVGSVNNAGYHDRIVQCAKDNGVEDALTVVPGLGSDDPLLVDAYHAADVFVLPSMHEPFGMVVLEAWAAGCPVIASRVGGIPDFVDDGVNGLLFESEDTDSFMQAFHSLTPERARTLSRAAREKVPQFGWNLVTERLIDLYKEVVHEHAAHRSGKPGPIVGQ